MKRTINYCLTGLFIFSLVILMISFSIGVPIYFRPFYYLHINGLNLVKNTGWSFNEIKAAYDDVLDFLVLNQPFATGVMRYSEQGKAHFEDCKILFDINFYCLLGSFIVSMTLIVLDKFKKIELKNILGFRPIFFSACLIILLLLIIGIFSIVDFNQVFTLFHKILFPGKNNWIFTPEFDQIILVLPFAFFRNCAILIGIILLTLTILSIIYSIIYRYKQKNR